MKKFLIVAHYSRFLVQFEMNDVKILQDLGYEVHYATNYEWEDMYIDAPEKIREAGVILHQIDFVRSPYKFSANIKAYRQLKKLMQDIDFSGVHCHTPMGGMLARMAAKATKTGPVLYTAHGFHFYKGAPLKNWLFYYPVEKLLSRWTDLQITINKEDYKIAKNKMYAKKVELIPGVGIDTKKFARCKVDWTRKREELGIPVNAFVLLSVSELIERKNHRVVIEALHKLNQQDIYYLMVGTGELKNEYEVLIKKYGLEKNIKLLGFRTDIGELCKISDCFIHLAKQEGLAVAPLEAMACELPLITSMVRGIKDYTEDGESGCSVFDFTSQDEIINAIKKMYVNRTFREQCGKNNVIKVCQYDVSNTAISMRRIYAQILNKDEDTK